MSMTKLIMTGSYDFDCQPVSLVDIHSRGLDRDWAIKRACALTDELRTIQADPHRTHLHIVAMGTTERYGPNRNADGFRRDELLRKHATFVTNGHVFKHHKNQDPAAASGIVKFSAFNDPMDRVELVVAVDNNKWANELNDLSNGKDLSFSMACKVAHDVCSICNNAAKSRAQYCQDMKKFAGQILADGRQVYVDNPDPTFFDISGVFKPADRIAYHLQKVASAIATTGAELAEEYGIGLPPLVVPPTRRSTHIWQKLAVLRKLSDIEKEIEGTAAHDDPRNLTSLRGAFSDQGDNSAAIDELKPRMKDRINQVMGMLGDARISLPVRDFLKLIVGNDTNVSAEEVEQALPGIFTRMQDEDPESLAEEGSYDPDRGGAGMPQGIRDIVERLVPGLSLADGPVHKRITMVIMRKSPKPLLTKASGIRRIKIAAVSAEAELLAREYAKYKLSFLADAMEKQSSDLFVRLGVLQHYVQNKE